MQTRLLDGLHLQLEAEEFVFLSRIFAVVVQRMQESPRLSPQLEVEQPVFVCQMFDSIGVENAGAHHWLLELRNSTHTCTTSTTLQF